MAREMLTTMWKKVELAELALFKAICKIQEKAKDAGIYASLAKNTAAEAAVFCSTEGLHLHGGYGFTTEYEISKLGARRSYYRYLRRCPGSAKYDYRTGDCLKMLYLHSMGHFHPENIISNKFLEDLDIGTHKRLDYGTCRHSKPPDGSASGLYQANKEC
ncbi:MAG: hypothetical protein MZV70_52640 [Desulfobacterales bacterium]|nr:hypothetical protein [Desulfobacterales bacterium]